MRFRRFIWMLPGCVGKVCFVLSGPLQHLIESSSTWRDQGNHSACGAAQLEYRSIAENRWIRVVRDSLGWGPHRVTWS
jgi:hypothetical protein